MLRNGNPIKISINSFLGEKISFQCEFSKTINRCSNTHSSSHFKTTLLLCRSADLIQDQYCTALVWLTCIGRMGEVNWEAMFGLRGLFLQMLRARLILWKTGIQCNVMCVHKSLDICLQVYIAFLLPIKTSNFLQWKCFVSYKKQIDGFWKLNLKNLFPP